MRENHRRRHLHSCKKHEELEYDPYSETENPSACVERGETRRFDYYYYHDEIEEQ